MFQLKIIDWRIRENRMGSFSQYEVVLDCELGEEKRKVSISSVVLNDEEAEDVYKDIAYVVNAGNSAIENA